MIRITHSNTSKFSSLRALFASLLFALCSLYTTSAQAYIIPCYIPCIFPGACNDNDCGDNVTQAVEGNNALAFEDMLRGNEDNGEDIDYDGGTHRSTGSDRSLKFGEDFGDILPIAMTAWIPISGISEIVIPLPNPLAGVFNILDKEKGDNILKTLQQDEFEIHIPIPGFSDILGGSQMSNYAHWWQNILGQRVIRPAIYYLTNQLMVVGVHQNFMIGQFFDADMQLTTQRQFQISKANIIKRYQPSQELCVYGTNTRYIASAEAVAERISAEFNTLQIRRHTGNQEFQSSQSRNADMGSRLSWYLGWYCDREDYGWDSTNRDGIFHSNACAEPRSDKVNIDIDYPRLVELKRTISSVNPVQDYDFRKADVFALSKNLYGHHLPLTRPLGSELAADIEKRNRYMIQRSITAKRSVAEHSFNEIVSMKFFNAETLNSPSSSNPAANRETVSFLGAAIKELMHYDPTDTNGSHQNAEIEYLLGKNPSFFAQLEVLSKKLFQNPDFYAGLFDKPANVARQSAALKAIETILDREIYESQTRREMMTSVLLSTELERRQTH